MWECGLKYWNKKCYVPSGAVTPLVGVWIEMKKRKNFKRMYCVTPLVGVWIEIETIEDRKVKDLVTPLVGVWIEITLSAIFAIPYRSLPLWECGLKFTQKNSFLEFIIVTPLVGVWIEIKYAQVYRKAVESLPLWECGLKLSVWFRRPFCNPSLPLWECGLKSKNSSDFL